MLNNSYLVLCLILCSPLLFEACLTPRPLPFWRRRFVIIILLCATWCFLFAFLMLIFRRCWFSYFILAAFQLLLLLVNFAKYTNLREVLLYQDFGYFGNTLRYPRFYIPFVGVFRLILAVLGFILAFIFGLKIEEPQSIIAVVNFSLPILIICGGLIFFALKRLPEISLDANYDLIQFGQIGFFWAYCYLELTTSIDYSSSPFLSSLTSIESPRPDIVVIQSESFFDIRELSMNISPKILSNYDSIRAQSHSFGRLYVPAWGANTVRTECSFLCGLGSESMGIHRFNPYRSLSKQAIPNLVAVLKELGYYTVCLHPFPRGFYLRDKVFPLMGFDEFIDIEGFSGETEGQYTSDLELAEKIKYYLAHKKITAGGHQPIFIFTMTMENHGPLHFEKPDTAIYEKYFNTEASEDYADLLVYLKHLKNADLMVKELHQELLRHSKDNPDGAILCWYGDHVPIMPQVYKTLAEPNGSTDFFIWSSNHLGQMPIHSDLDISQLAKSILSLFKATEEGPKYR